MKYLSLEYYLGKEISNRLLQKLKVNARVEDHSQESKDVSARSANAGNVNTQYVLLSLSIGKYLIENNIMTYQ